MDVADAATKTRSSNNSKRGRTAVPTGTFLRANMLPTMDLVDAWKGTTTKVALLDILGLCILVRW
jgi:hypothetical protein